MKSTVLSLPLGLVAIILSFSLTYVSATVTLYATTGPNARPTPCVGAVPCDGAVLELMPNPQGLTNTIPVQVSSTGTEIAQLAQNVHGSFLGFSIELSIADKIFGEDGNAVNPIFLNLMAAMTDRVGKVLVRVGGNSQEQATVVPEGLPNGQAILKPQVGASRTFTPLLLISPNLIYTMGNVSALLPGVHWFMGVPFNDTADPRPLMAELSQAVLGDKLLGLQLGNEPDLYHINQIRGPDYNETQYTQDWGTVLDSYKNNPAITNSKMFVAPSVCCGGDIGWTPEQVFQTGFLDLYADNLAYISVEHYPQNNCNSSGTSIDPNTLLASTYLNHDSVKGLTQPYLATAQTAADHAKPFIMFETNTASCGGFSGLSDSFVSAMWMVDYALDMSSNGFSNALLHVGGQSDYYNPFTPSSTNQSTFHQWTVGNTFYSALVVAEALGSSGQARVADLNVNAGGAGTDGNPGNTQLTPGYAIFENGAPQRLVLINYMSNADGQPPSDYTALVSIGGNADNTPGAIPASVQVKYLRAPSANDKYNTTWGGQTYGGPFASDGRVTGALDLQTVQCDQANNVCAINVPAPGVALVFLTPQAVQESEMTATQTFATTYTPPLNGPANTASVDQAVLATSNGHGGENVGGLGSTSFGSVNEATSIRQTILTSAAVHGVMAMVGAAVVLWLKM